MAQSSNQFFEVRRISAIWPSER